MHTHRYLMKKAKLKSITAVKLIEIFMNYIVDTFNVPLQVMLSESSTKPWLQEQYSCPSEPTAHCCVQLSFEQVDLAGKKPMNANALKNYV